MNKQILNIIIVLVLGLVITSCKKTKENTTIGKKTALLHEDSSQKYVVNTTESVIEWKGFKPTGSHNGTISIENGEFTMKSSEINSGTFSINMKSIKEAENNTRLEGHLMSPDFFDVEKFPNATFEITGIETNILSGNLTLKDITNNVSFPISISHDGEVISLVSETFTINRSKWNVRYKSKSFFNDLGNKFIDDNIEIKITIKANKV